jgi:peroxiredoxin
MPNRSPGGGDEPGLEAAPPLYYGATSDGDGARGTQGAWGRAGEEGADSEYLGPGDGSRMHRGVWRAQYPGKPARPDRVDLARCGAVLLAGAALGIGLVLLVYFLLESVLRSSTSPPALLPSPTPQGSGAGTSREQAALDASSLPPEPVVGRYPPDFTLRTPGGGEVTLSALQGRPAWINFRASWCPPCRAETPQTPQTPRMQQRYSQYIEHGLVIVGVDVGEDAARVAEFVEQEGFQWTFALDGGGEASRRYQASGPPLHLFVGRDGTARAVQ